MDHPYPDHAYLDVDAETNEKRWFSSNGMGVRYVHEDRAEEDLQAAVKAEREACAKIAEARAAEGERHTWQAQEGVFIAADIRARS
jgi:hypothetical protein